MTLRELLDTLKGLGATLTLHDGDTITMEPPDGLTPAVRAALTEHHAALVALIRSGPAAPSSFDTLLAAFDGVGTRPSPEILRERLRILAASLAGAEPLVRELVRAEAIARLAKLGVRAAARLVDAVLTARLSDSGRVAPGRWLLVADPDPWPEAVDGAALLDELAHTYRRFVSLPKGGAEALALWIVFTYALEAFDVAPILALCSPLKRCGKTTTEEVATALAQRPLAGANITVAALYRTVERFASGRTAGGVPDQGQANSPGGPHAQGIPARGLHGCLPPLPACGSETPRNIRNTARTPLSSPARASGGLLGLWRVEDTAHVPDPPAKGSDVSGATDEDRGAKEG